MLKERSDKPFRMQYMKQLLPVYDSSEIPTEGEKRARRGERGQRGFGGSMPWCHPVILQYPNGTLLQIWRSRVQANSDVCLHGPECFSLVSEECQVRGRSACLVLGWTSP